MIHMQSGKPNLAALKPLPKWLPGVRVQANVIHALMLREALKDHGHHGLGFFWIIGEPLLLLVGIMILWSFAHVSHSSEVDAIPFALTGYGFITLWRHISGRSVKILRQNKALRYHNQLKYIDMLIAKALIETVSVFTTFCVCYVPLALFGACPIWSDPLMVVVGFIMTGWFAFGVSLILSSLSEISSLVQNAIGAIMYITLPLTGAFTMQEWLPERVRNLLAWSPLVNCVEMIRGGFFPNDVPVHWSGLYLISCCFLVTCIGVFLLGYGQRFVED